jgi:hypothetical protein
MMATFVLDQIFCALEASLLCTKYVYVEWHPHQIAPFASDLVSSHHEKNLISRHERSNVL